MNYTNTSDLPQPLVSAIQFSDYDKVGDISVTGLIQPPRIRQLTKRHYNEITEDVSEGIWRLIGSIGHKILERADTDNHLAEERLTMKADGWTISGKADLLGPDMTLYDYKFSSVWALKDAKPEYEQQLNLYAFLYGANGFHVEKARIVAVLRDWSKLKASREPDYPQVGVVVREVPLWSHVEQGAFLIWRVNVHQEAEKVTDDNLPLCTEAERWRKPEIFAIKKKGGKRAISGGLHPNLESAMAGKPLVGAYDIEHRPGQDVRCLNYCAVRQFCSYGKTLAMPASDEAA